MADESTPRNRWTKSLLSDDQDPEQAQRVFARVSEILTPSETIDYIAVQKPLLAITPDSVVLTSRRFIVYRPRMFGRVDFVDYIWRDLRDARLKHGMISSTLSFKTAKDESVVIENLPKKQASRLYAIAQEREELCREERRQRDLEEKRAAAGHHVTNLSTAHSDPVQARKPESDPVARLAQLKAMLENGLIEQAEFDTKKAEILSRL